MSPVETHRIACQKPAHYRGEGGGSCPPQYVKGICHKRPCKTKSLAFGQDIVESIQKIISVSIIKKNLSSINPPHNDMVQRSRGVYTGFSRHTVQISKSSDFVNRKSEERPPFPLELFSVVIQFFECFPRLHLKHKHLRFSISSEPPFETGIIWSTSRLASLPLAPHKTH